MTCGRGSRTTLWGMTRILVCGLSCLNSSRCCATSRPPGTITAAVTPMTLPMPHVTGPNFSHSFLNIPCPSLSLPVPPPVTVCAKRRARPATAERRAPRCRNAPHDGGNKQDAQSHRRKADMCSATCTQSPHNSWPSPPPVSGLSVILPNKRNAVYKLTFNCHFKEMFNKDRNSIHKIHRDVCKKIGHFK